MSLFCLIQVKMKKAYILLAAVLLPLLTALTQPPQPQLSPKEKFPSPLSRPKPGDPCFREGIKYDHLSNLIIGCNRCWCWSGSIFCTNMRCLHRFDRPYVDIE